MTDTGLRRVALSFQVSDWTLWRAWLKLQVFQHALLAEDANTPAEPRPPACGLTPGSRGFMLRSVPVPAHLPALQRAHGYLRYVPLQYRHCYVDLQGGFERYRQKFSSKTRATIARKLRKFSEHCGGALRWAAYRTPQEINTFFPLARQVSRKTYQERLLDAGLPEDPAFVAAALAAAAGDRLRAWLLFDGDRPVAYLYCPAQAEVLVYAYLGYDPEYQKHSVGTVLQWLAFEQLFAEAQFRYFDFTEGQSEHKRLFATHERQCANVMFLRDDWRSRLLLHSHRAFAGASAAAGALLARWGLKARVRRLLRAGG